MECFDEKLNKNDQEGSWLDFFKSMGNIQNFDADVPCSSKKKYCRELLFWSTVQTIGSKGQLISKANCQASNSSKKRTINSFLLECDEFSFVFWKKLKTPKKALSDFSNILWKEKVNEDRNATPWRLTTQYPYDMCIIICYFNGF